MSSGFNNAFQGKVRASEGRAERLSINPKTPKPPSGNLPKFPDDGRPRLIHIYVGKSDRVGCGACGQRESMRPACRNACDPAALKPRMNFFGRKPTHCCHGASRDHRQRSSLRRTSRKGCPQIHRPRSRHLGIPKNSQMAGGRDLSIFMWVSPPEWDVELVGNTPRGSGVPEPLGQQTCAAGVISFGPRPNQLDVAVHRAATPGDVRACEGRAGTHRQSRMASKRPIVRGR